MIPSDKVKNIIEKYNSLEKELSSGKFDPKLFAKKSKEYSDLKNIIGTAKEYLNFDKNKKYLNNIINDKQNDSEIITLAQKELETAETKEVVLKKLKIFLYPRIVMMKKMLSWKLELVLGVSRLHYLQLICLECMKRFALKRDGR